MSNDLEYYLGMQEVVNITVPVDLLNCLEDCKQQKKALEIIKQKPLESGICINYININIEYPTMLDYEHYCMTIKEDKRVDKNEFEILKEVFSNE